MTAHENTTGADARPGFFGQSLPRVEDGRLLRGEGRFVDDLHVPDAAEVAFLRSPFAHATITSIDVSAAQAMPGVVAVYDGAAVLDRIKPLLNAEELRVPPGIAELNPINKLQPAPILALDEVNYVGQPIAMVVAESRYLAEDAVEAIDVEFEELPAVIDVEEALASGAPRVLLDEPDNIGVHIRHGVGDADAALAGAVFVVEETFATQRYVAAPIETRGMVAQQDPFTGSLMIWSTTQTPHRVRDHVAESIGVPVDEVRVQSVDVGGGFGQKGILVVEELLIPFATHDLGRPVRWIADRYENLTADAHAREQVHNITLGADADGRLVAVKDRIVVNAGARNMVGLVVPYNALCHLLGMYKVANVDLEAFGVITNTMFTSPYRGAGRPEATFAMERAMDRLAAKVGIEPSELRQRNLVPAEEMPYRTGLLDRRGVPQEFDSGDYPEMMRRTVELIGLDAFRARQADARAEGRHLGIGFATYLEMTGLGPFEGAKVEVMPSGRVRLYTGAPSQGQGHGTVFAQLLADSLGVDVGDVDVVAGDTASIPYGVGTIASRALVTAGNAIDQAGSLLQERILTHAAELLEASVDDLVMERGRVSVTGTPAVGVTLGELIRAVPKLAGGSGADGLEETSYFQPPNYATASGVHAAVVEVDSATGIVEIVDYVVVHEAGRIVNPVIADAQVVGGVGQGVGGALCEHMRYDDRGQPITSTFLDYLMPVASMMPEVHLDEIVCPSPTNPLGVKGLGEGGAVGPPAALANAVEDALSPFDIVVRSGPLSPSAILDLLR
ncbi:MAG: xanthine dehydrogenase family protein molybdopterin-binding subunit [Acidimicrobiales bacterium]